MAGLSQDVKGCFPLNSLDGVVRLFQLQLASQNEPNLAFMSLVTGYLENRLTVNRTLLTATTAASSNSNSEKLPVLTFSTVEALYQRFVIFIKSSVDLSKYDTKRTTRDLVKKISDVVWSQLSRSYNDKAHLQSLYSYLTGNKLDCFGLAFAVVASCQILGLNDVHLALSEDHAWVVYGDNETAEITWHGKGNEDKRGQPIDDGVTEKSWLYLNNNAVVCDRYMEVAAMVSSINPSISGNTDSTELGELQKRLLWLLYDRGHLDRYPMSLGNLGDLEEISPSKDRPIPEELFRRAIDAAKSCYDDHHVYPYTYLGGYYYRKTEYKKALETWAHAADVIKKYNYNKDDEEVYKEFMEISTDYIPTIAKVKSEGELEAEFKLQQLTFTIAGRKGIQSTAQFTLNTSCGEMPFLTDPECYRLLLQFYDGICQWEEGSKFPVLHIGWANNILYALGKFQPDTRGSVALHNDGEPDESEKSDNSDEDDEKENVTKNDACKAKKEVSGNSKLSAGRRQSRAAQRRRTSTKKPGHDVISDSKPAAANGHQNSASEERIKSQIQALEDKVDKVEGAASSNHVDNINPDIATLSKSCGVKLFNPEYLVGGNCNSEPFAAPTKGGAESTASTPSISSATSAPSLDACSELRSDVRVDDFLSSRSSHSPFGGMDMTSVLHADSPAPELAPEVSDHENHVVDNDFADAPIIDRVCDTPKDSASLSPDTANNNSSEATKSSSNSLMLYSAKMKGLKALLRATKLNSSAIKLQLTAQSQVAFKHRGSIGANHADGPPRKRARRSDAT